MAEPAIRLVHPESLAAGEAAAAPDPPSAASSPRIVGDPLGFIPLVDLAPVWPDGSTPEAQLRNAQRYCETLSRDPKSAALVLKTAGRWSVSPLAPDPTCPPESGSTVRDFLFVRTGKVVGELLGVCIRPALREAILTWTDKKRAQFFTYCELVRQRGEHEQRFSGLKRAERDRLFRGDPDRQRFCVEHNIGRWSARSVREWRAKVEAGIDPDARGRPRLDDDGAEDQCSPEAWAHFRVLYLDPRRRSIRLCWELVAAEAGKSGWTWPQIHTMRRRVKRELPPSIADYYRLGPRRWESRYQTFIQRDRAAQYRPNESWVCDHTRLDFWILRSGKLLRPWLTVWQDMSSGLIIAWAITLQPHSDVILATFRAGVLKYGAPLRVLFDNGRDFRANTISGGRKRFNKARVDDVMQRLGIAVTWAEPCHGQSKPVERLFATVTERYCKLTTTYCGNSPATRPETLNAGLKSGKILAPELPEILASFAAFVEVYNNRPSEAEGREGRTPAEVFAVNPIAKRTAPPEVLDELLLPVTRCTVGRLGVEVRGLHYGQDELRLHPWKGCTVGVRFDPLDAGRVVVLDPEGRRIAECFNRRLRGVTHDDIRQAKRRKKAALRLVQSAYPAREDRLLSVPSLAAGIAAQRRVAEQQVKQRVAAGAEGQAPAARDLQLLPGAAEAAAAVQVKRSREVAEERAPTQDDLLALLRPTAEELEERRAAKEAEREREALCRELLATPMHRAPDIESSAEAQERLLHELGEVTPVDGEDCGFDYSRFGAVVKEEGAA